jgi:hypothetical protein
MFWGVPANMLLEIAKSNGYMQQLDLDLDGAPILNISEEYLEYVNVPYGTPDSETMIAMSYAQKIIISNSTFAWWAAKLGEQKLCVCAPSKWFFNRKDPENLLPNHWIKIESVWQ